MKRSVVVVALMVVTSIAVPTEGTAETHVYAPVPADCWDLDHHRYYTWGIDVSDLVGWTITEMELNIVNINNWDNNTNVLFIHLLDEAALGLNSYGDDENSFGDPFVGQGGLVDAWHDVNGTAVADTLHYVFSDLGLIPTANAYAQDGVLALGLDPDCHYWNDGIELIISVECPSSGTEDRSWGEVKRLFCLERTGDRVIREE